MASPIQQIRSIIQDKPLHVREAVHFDSAAKLFALTNFPLVVSSVVVSSDPQPDSVDGDTGVMTYTEAPDTADVFVDYSCVVLSDQTIQDLIDILTDLGDGDYDIRIAAAMALESVASNQALILKVIKNQDLQTDGARVAEAFMKHADVLRKSVFDPKYQEPAFDFIEQINDLPGYKEKVLKDWLRNG